MYVSSAASLRLSAAPTRRALLPGIFLAALLFSLLLAARPAAALVSTVSYTGQLLAGTSAVANGQYDFQFSLFTAPTGGSPVGSTLSVANVTVANGIFYVELNFGSVYNGQTLYLETKYRKTGTTTYTTQSPRKEFGVQPYAQYANISGSTKALQGKSISTTAPSSGQVLTWNGSLWTPTTPTTGVAYTAGTGLTLSGNQFSVTPGGITGSLLANNAVGNSNLAPNSVSGSKLVLPLAAVKSSSSDLFAITNTSSGSAFTGTSASGYAVKGILGAASGLTGYFPSPILGDTNTGNGVIGRTSASGGFGVLGITDSNGVYGVYGTTANTSGTGVVGDGGSTGVSGNGTTYGVYGSSSGPYGVYGYGNGYGVYGFDSSGSSYGVVGAGGAVGVYGSGTSEGLYGSGGTYGVYGTSSNVGVYGDSTNVGVWGHGGAYGIVGEGTTKAGYFFNDVYVGGTLSKAGGSFKIDDPLDPAHKFLSHSFVESPDMKNIYDGTATLDESGAAAVTLPKWFQALNQDFRYQLTAIGAPGPNLYIAQEIEGNKFTIAGGQPGAKVSWQVTGTRHDAWANAHRIPVEEDKPEDQQGLYLNPKEFGLPESRLINFQLKQEAAQGRPKLPALPVPSKAQPPAASTQK